MEGKTKGDEQGPLQERNSLAGTGGQEHTGPFWAPDVTYVMLWEDTCHCGAPCLVFCIHLPFNLHHKTEDGVVVFAR